MSAKITGVAPQLLVSDVVKTAEFYRDVLGFNILGYFGEPPVFSMVARDDKQIHFGKLDGNQAVRVNLFRKEGVDVVLWTDNIDSLFEELKQKKADIVEGIVRRSYGREFVIRDCDGHLLAIVD